MCTYNRQLRIWVRAIVTHLTRKKIKKNKRIKFVFFFHFLPLDSSFFQSGNLLSPGSTSSTGGIMSRRRSVVVAFSDELITRSGPATAAIASTSTNTTITSSSAIVSAAASAATSLSAPVGSHTNCSAEKTTQTSEGHTWNTTIATNATVVPLVNCKRNIKKTYYTHSPKCTHTHMHIPTCTHPYVYTVRDYYYNITGYSQ